MEVLDTTSLALVTAGTMKVWVGLQDLASVATRVSRNDKILDNFLVHIETQRVAFCGATLWECWTK